MLKREKLKLPLKEPGSVKGTLCLSYCMKNTTCYFDGPHDVDFDAVPDYLWNMS